MAITNGYITLAQLKTYLGLSGSGQDDNLENAVEAASREIDAYCGRFFYQTSSDGNQTVTYEVLSKQQSIEIFQPIRQLFLPERVN